MPHSETRNSTYRVFPDRTFPTQDLSRRSIDREPALTGSDSETIAPTSPGLQESIFHGGIPWG